MSIRTLLGALLIGSTAAAAPTVSCDTCQSCTAALAKPAAVVKLAADVKAPTGVGICVEIKGAGAQLIGDGHTLSSTGTGVRINASGVNLRRLTVQGGVVAVAVDGPRATLLDLTTVDAKKGIVAGASAEGLRVVRSSVRGGEIGIELGAAVGTRCPKSAKNEIPDVVISGTTVTGAKMGIVACAALPVIADCTLTKNGFGLLYGRAAPNGPEPKDRGPYDSCACAPEIKGVQPSTTLLFSSGCGGCKVHESWLPEVRQQGYDISLRPTGKENKAAMARYDAFLRRCAPEINDAIGIPGCVPNYACLASNRVFKRRGEGGRLAFDAKINSPEAMAEFAARCVASAQEHYTGEAGCVKSAIRNTTLCGNTHAGRILSPRVGADNACDSLKGATAALGCTRSCP